MKEEETLTPYTTEEMEKEFYSPEEAYELVMNDVQSIYFMKNAI